MVRIDSTGFGFIVVDGKRYEHDVIVSYEGKVEKDLLETRHSLSEKEFFRLVRENPEVIIIGTGQHGVCEVSKTFLELAKSRKVEVIVEKSPKAVSKFNELTKAGKRAVAYIHVTC